MHGIATGAASIATAALAAAGVGLGIEAAGRRAAAPDIRPAALAARLGLQAALFLAWFSLCWRPLLAAAAAVVTVAVLRLVSEAKRRLVGEPLAFSDLALLRQAVEHPDLYYVDARALLPAAALAALVGAWMWWEPPALRRDPVAAALAVAALPLALAGAARAGCRRLAALAARLAEPFGPEPDALARALVRGEARLGLALSLAVGLSRWEARRRGPPPRAVPVAGPPLAHPRATLRPGPRTVVVVQVESFVDPAGVPGGRPAPHLDRLRRAAILQGTLGVPGHGAYTMRSEFAVLSGLEGAEIGEEGFDPYLSAAGRAAAGRGFATLATALRGRGHRTVFVHPFRRGFFGRDRVLPALGFDRLVMEEGFEGAERVGGRVSDAAVAQRVLAEVDAAPGPVLVFAVTMQNHGPWRVEHDPPAGTPLARYRDNLADADRMIGALLDGLLDRLEARGAPALLCVYGDHPPILDAVGPPRPGPTTPYAVAMVGAAGPGARRDLSAAALGRVLLALAGG